jgi:hypothetical protein
VDAAALLFPRTLGRHACTIGQKRHSVAISGSSLQTPHRLDANPAACGGLKPFSVISLLVRQYDVNREEFAPSREYLYEPPHAPNAHGSDERDDV